MVLMICLYIIGQHNYLDLVRAVEERGTRGRREPAGGKMGFSVSHVMTDGRHPSTKNTRGANTICLHLKENPVGHHTRRVLRDVLVRAERVAVTDLTFWPSNLLRNYSRSDNLKSMLI